MGLELKMFAFFITVPTDGDAKCVPKTKSPSSAYASSASILVF